MEILKITSSDSDSRTLNSDSRSLNILPYVSSESGPEVQDKIDIPSVESAQQHHNSDELVIVGDLYSIEEIVDGMYARTKSTVFDDTDQSWYWSEKWQDGERAVQEHIRKGEVETFDSMDEFLSTLDDNDE